MKMPNFIGIGAGKSGTKSLYNYLKQHPQIYMCPVMEPNFFVFEGEILNFRGPNVENEMKRFITNIEDYRALFQGVSDEKAIGEISPRHLPSPKAPERIKRYVPDAKLIAILQNPIERSYSAYMMWVRDGLEPCASFSEAIMDEERRIQDNWIGGMYISPGFYYKHLKRYFNLFDRNQLKVYLYEDLEINTPCMLKDIFSFLEVDDTFVPDTSIKHNVSGVYRNKLMYILLSPNPVKNKLKELLPDSLRQPFITYITNLKNLNLIKPPLTPELRKELISLYREDILKLQDLIRWDLSKWLE